MKIGINRWSLQPDLSLAECFSLVKRCGFDSIEINIAEDGELTTRSNESEVKAIVARAHDVGIELSSLSTGLGWRSPMTSSDSAVRRQGIDNVKRQLEVAHWMGVDTILVVPGIVNADTAYDDAYTRAQAALTELAPFAEQAGVAIGVENVWNKFLLSPLEFARFLDEIGSRWVGAYFDAGNILAYGYPDHWIKILSSRILKVHVKDFKSSIGNITGFCNPLQGDVPWEKVRAALDSVKYDGYVTAEVEGYKVRHEIGVRHIAESLRSIFG